jgi:synaptojanin
LASFGSSLGNFFTKKADENLVVWQNTIAQALNAKTSED